MTPCAGLKVMNLSLILQIYILAPESTIKESLSRCVYIAVGPGVSPIAIAAPRAWLSL